MVLSVNSKKVKVQWLAVISSEHKAETFPVLFWHSLPCEVIFKAESASCGPEQSLITLLALTGQWSCAKQNRSYIIPNFVPLQGTLKCSLMSLNVVILAHFKPLLLNISTFCFLFLFLLLPSLQFTIGPVKSQCDPPVVFRQDRGVVIDQEVFQLGYDGIFPVVQYLGQVGASVAAGVFCWRQTFKRCSMMYYHSCKFNLKHWCLWKETCLLIINRQQEHQEWQHIGPDL